MLIRYWSAADRPPHRVSCDLLQDDSRLLQLEGSYRHHTWLFNAPDEDTWNHCRLRLDGQVIVAEAYRPEDTVMDLERIPKVRPVIWPDGGHLARVWFDEGERDKDLWDLIIVGQGMGGGVLHAALSAQVIRGTSTQSTLGLEAGGLLFSTHVANMPRVFVNDNPGGTPAVWSTLDTFGVHADGSTDSNARNFEVFALGGRSLYWGGLSPRADRSEIDRWGSGRAIATDLFEPTADRPAYYAAAEQLLGVGSPEAGPIQQSLIDLLDAVLPGRSTRAAPMAVKHLPPASQRLPTGLFSTAELLLEQRLSKGHSDGDGSDEFGPPNIHLNELVLAVQQERDGTWIVHTVRLPDGARTRRRANRIVLCAGTIETARIMHASQLANAPNALIGNCFTEHTMAYRHFQIPPDSPFHDPTNATHLLSMPGASGTQWNLQLQLGSDALLDRRLSRLGRSIATTVEPGWVAGQMVFLDRTDLDPAGKVGFQNDPWMDLDDPSPPNLQRVALHYADRRLHSDWQDVSDRLMGALGAKHLDDASSGVNGPELSAPGVVSHEVGTMRLGIDGQTGVVADDLQVVGCPGLYICDNSVFATSPAANPSLTLAALALRLADHLARRPS